MGRLLLACDLDNTLIHSYKHRQENDICIEWIEGQEQGFMTAKSRDLLEILAGQALIVPVTSRSLEQYRRIKWPGGWQPEYAITTNSGILLHNGEVDREWQQKSLEVVKPWKEELDRLAELLVGQGRRRCVRIVDGMYLFAYRNEDMDAEQWFGEGLGQTYLDVISSGRKIYFLPPKINKAEGLKRLRQKVRISYAVCAGDSRMDISMLKEADLAIVPDESLADQVAGKDKKGKPIAVCSTGKNFAEFLLETCLFHRT